MQFRDLVGMSPLQKYQKFNFPPYKAVVGMLLVFFTTVETLTMMKANVYSSVNQVKSFTYLYFDPKLYDDKIFIQSQHFNIRETGQLITHFQYLFDNLNSVGNQSLQKLSLRNAQMKLLTHLQSYDGETITASEVVIDIPNGKITQPFDSTGPRSIQDYLFNVSRFQIVVAGIQLRVGGIDTKWTHRIAYQFSYRGQLDIHIDMRTLTNSEPQSVEGYHFRLLVVIYSVVIMLAILSLVLNYSYFSKLVVWLVDYSQKISQNERINRPQVPKYMYGSLAEWMEENDVSLRNLTVGEWLQLVDIWIITSTVGNACQIIGSILLIFSFRGAGVVGVGCLIAWLGIFRYLRYVPSFTVLNQVLGKSASKLVVFMIQFIPVFIAFVLFATTAFWKVEQFSSPMKTVNVQMCMMLGDSIQLFTNLISAKCERYLAIMYTFGFVISFMHGIHNLLTALIKENFINNKIEKARRRLQLKGMSHKTSIEQLKPSYQNMKQKIDVDYSIIYQNQLFRKEVKGILDAFIYKIQKTFLAIDIYHKRLQEDFDRNLRYSDLSLLKTSQLKASILSQLKGDYKRIQQLKARVSRLQS